MGKESTCMQEMLETWVQFLGWEDPNQEGMAIDSIILAWRILWTEEPGRLQNHQLSVLTENKGCYRKRQQSRGYSQHPPESPGP